jgi:hypothetical protein
MEGGAKSPKKCPKGKKLSRTKKNGEKRKSPICIPKKQSPKKSAKKSPKKWSKKQKYLGEHLSDNAFFKKIHSLEQLMDKHNKKVGYIDYDSKYFKQRSEMLMNISLDRPLDYKYSPKEKKLYKNARNMGYSDEMLIEGMKNNPKIKKATKDFFKTLKPL